MQGRDDPLNLGLVCTGGTGGTHVDLARTAGCHNFGDVVSAQTTRHQDDDILSPALHEAGESARLCNGRITTRRQHAVIAELHENVETSILIYHLVEATVEGQRRVLSRITQARGRIHVDVPVARHNADDKAKSHRCAPTDRREGLNIRGDAIDLLASVDEVTWARAYEHLDTAGGRHLQGSLHIVECGSQAATRQVGADLDAIRSPVSRTAHTHSVFDANFNNRHGCHLS